MSENFKKPENIFQRVKQSLLDVVTSPKLPLLKRGALFASAAILAFSVTDAKASSGKILPNGPTGRQVSQDDTNNRIQIESPNINEGDCIILNDGKDGVNIRIGPGTSYSKIGLAGDNSLLPYIGEAENGWFEVSLSDGQTGFITDDYTQKVLCEEGLRNILEKNPHLLNLSVHVLNGPAGELTVFGFDNLKEYGFKDMTLDLIYANYQVVSSQLSAEYPSIHPPALAFMTQEEMFGISFESRHASSYVNGRVGGVWDKITSAGHLVSAEGDLVNGSTFNAAIVAVDASIGEAQLMSVTAHELGHVRAGIPHMIDSSGKADYSRNHPTMQLQYSASTGYLKAFNNGFGSCSSTHNPAMCESFATTFADVMQVSHTTDDDQSLDSNSTVDNLENQEIFFNLTGNYGSIRFSSEALGHRYQRQDEGEDIPGWVIPGISGMLPSSSLEGIES